MKTLADRDTAENSYVQKLLAKSLFSMMDGVAGRWWEVQEHTGLPVDDCIRILHAYDVTVLKFGNELIPGGFVSPFKACTLSQFFDKPDECVRSECFNAFGDTNRQHYSDADRRFIFVTMLDRDMADELAFARDRW